MLLCKGKQCIWRKVCSRYVIGKGMTQYAGCGDTWIDHCFGAKKFIAINSEEGRQVAEKLNQGKEDRP